MTRFAGENWKAIIAICTLAMTAMLGLISTAIVSMWSTQSDLTSKVDFLSGQLSVQLPAHERRIEYLEQRVNGK
jgi:hypothetical protein